MRPAALRATRLAVAGVFFPNGFGFATWVVRIPALQEKLTLSEGPLGIALLGSAVGVLLAAPPTGWLVSRLGSRPVVRVWALLLSLVLLPLALAPSVSFLVAALLMAGALPGCWTCP